MNSPRGQQGSQHPGDKPPLLGKPTVMPGKASDPFYTTPARGTLDLSGHPNEASLRDRHSHEKPQETQQQRHVGSWVRSWDTKKMTAEPL